MTQTTNPKTQTPRSDLRVAIFCASLAAGMVGMSYAAVPLYRLFCQVTGFAGTPQVAIAPSETVLDKTIVMRFDANVSKELAWKFEPVKHTIDLRIGENKLAYYRATNLSDKPLSGTATFNVSPDSAGIHFNKIECFCFTEQLLQPGESVEMPVSFFVDAGIVDDPNAAHISQLTLSYTFHPLLPGSEEKSAKVVDEPAQRAGG